MNRSAIRAFMCLLTLPAVLLLFGFADTEPRQQQVLIAEMPLYLEEHLDAAHTMPAIDVPIALLSRQVLAESSRNIINDDDPSQHHFMKSIVLLLVVFFIGPVPFYFFLDGLAKVDCLWGWQDDIHDSAIRATFSCAIFLFNVGPTYIGFLIDRNDRCAEHNLRNL